jgi:hypothetical protein
VKSDWPEQERYLDGDTSRPFKVWYDAAHGCARFWARGSFNGAEARRMNDVEKQLMDDLGKVHWLIEIGECKFDSAARAVFVEAGKDARNGKLAFVGLPAPIRWMLTLIGSIQGKGNRERQFAATDVERAFAWFRDETS